MKSKLNLCFYRAAITALVALLMILFTAATSSAVIVKKAGKLQVPPNAQLFAFSTDPTVQQVLAQDFRATRRSADPNATTAFTVTVTVTSNVLAPGVSLGQIAPGDPDVAKLLKEAGEKPPPIGDTGNKFDQGAIAQRLESAPQLPTDTAMGQLLNGMAAPSEAPPLPQAAAPVSPDSPGFEGDVKQYMEQGEGGGGYARRPAKDVYNTVIVARATASGESSVMTVIAIVAPGEDLNMAKQLVAEEIANAILH